MALRTLGTGSTTSLPCLTSWSQVLTPADMAAVCDAICPDERFGTILGGYGPGATAVLATGSSHTSTALDTLVSTGGAALAQIQVGDLVLKADVPLGTYVAALVSGTAVTLSAAATGSASGRVNFVRNFSGGGFDALDIQNGLLYVPGRGVLKIRPGDIVAVDPLTGWPILVSANAISITGSLWTLT